MKTPSSRNPIVVQHNARLQALKSVQAQPVHKEERRYTLTGAVVAATVVLLPELVDVASNYADHVVAGTEHQLKHIYSRR